MVIFNLSYFTIHVDKIKLWEVPVTNKCVACAQIGIHSFNGHIRGLRGTSALHATEGLRVRDPVTVHTSVCLWKQLKEMAQCATHSCAYQQNLEKQKHYSDRSCSTRRALIGENTVCFLHKQCLSYFKVSVFLF